MGKKKIRIGIAGTRGIPSKYGGFETFAEMVSVELARRGYEVTVYCDKDSYPSSGFNSVHLQFLPITKSFNQVVYFFLSLLRALRQNDFVIVTSTAASYFYFLNIFYRRKIITNTDGVESRRQKWSYIERQYLKISEYFAVKFSDHIVGDATGIVNYLKSTYKIKRPISVIEYGAPVVCDELNPIKNWRINGHSFEKQSYMLVVARLEKENNINLMVEGYLLSGVSLPLIIVGNYSDKKYYQQLLDLIRNHPKIHLLGGIYDKQLLQEIRLGAVAYLHGHSVGGTNPSLLEAMGCGNICLCHDNIYNREVTANNMYYFSTADDFSDALKKILTEPIDNILKKKAAARNRIKNYYSWEKITNKYLDLIEGEKN